MSSEQPCDGVIIMNFSHPLTERHQLGIAALIQRPITRVIDVMNQLDLERDIEDQVHRMLDASGLTPSEWQTAPLLINPPALTASAVVTIAMIAGRSGYLPSVLVWQRTDQTPPTYQPAHVINLQAVRDWSRRSRD